jgi:hypothetical protein
VSEPVDGVRLAAERSEEVPPNTFKKRLTVEYSFGGKACYLERGARVRILPGPPYVPIRTLVFFI